MSKYIIEIKPEYEDSFKGLMILGAKDSNLFVDTLAVENLEELNSDYINEHFGDLQDDAYNKGYAQCQDDYSDALKHAKDTAYQRGLDDAWEAARKICLGKEDGGISNGALLEIFKVGSDYSALKNYSASEAIEKLKAYEEKQNDDKIEVGDVVETQNKKRFIVTTLDSEIAIGVCADGLGVGVDLKELRKTGKHFDIDKILKEMKGDNDK